MYDHCFDCQHAKAADKMERFDCLPVEVRRTKYGEDYGHFSPSRNRMKPGFTTQLWRMRNA